jgi:hypothetical protein
MYNGNTMDEESGDDKFTEEFEIEFQREIKGLGRSTLLQLKRAGYTSLSDFRGTSQEDLIQVDKIGPTVAGRILSYAERNGVSGISAKSSNTTNGTEDSNKLSDMQLKTRLEQYYNPDEDESNWYRCQRMTKDENVCNAKIYFSVKNLTDLRRHEKSHSKDGTGKEPSRSKRTASIEKEATQKEQTSVGVLNQIENEFEDI